MVSSKAGGCQFLIRIIGFTLVSLNFIVMMYIIHDIYEFGQTTQLPNTGSEPAAGV